jgi:pimeloyl-ACP methyl ester carboxylesterase
MPTIAVRDLHLYYEEHGDPAGEPLVLLHGFLSTGEVTWAAHLSRLGTRYRLLVPDWRGHGRTTNPAGVIVHAELANDIAAFAQAMGLSRAHFCGHSSGGMLLLFLARDHPELVGTLTLVSTTYTFDGHVQGAVLLRTTNVPEERMHALQVRHGETRGPGYARTLLDLWAASVERPGELPFEPEDLEEIRCPTLILHGDRDPFFPVFDPVTMYDALPKAELCILPACGHSLPHERPALFADVLLDFLQRFPL